MSKKKTMAFNTELSATVDVRDLSCRDCEVIISEENIEELKSVLDDGIGFIVDELEADELELLISLINIPSGIIKQALAHARKDNSVIILGKEKISIQLKQ